MILLMSCTPTHQHTNPVNNRPAGKIFFSFSAVCTDVVGPRYPTFSARMAAAEAIARRKVPTVQHTAGSDRAGGNGKGNASASAKHNSSNPDSRSAPYASPKRGSRTENWGSNHNSNHNYNSTSNHSTTHNGNGNGTSSGYCSNIDGSAGRMSNGSDERPLTARAAGKLKAAWPVGGCGDGDTGAHSGYREQSSYPAAAVTTRHDADTTAATMSPMRASELNYSYPGRNTDSAFSDSALRSCYASSSVGGAGTSRAGAATHASVSFSEHPPTSSSTPTRGHRGSSRAHHGAAAAVGVSGAVGRTVDAAAKSTAAECLSHRLSHRPDPSTSYSNSYSHSNENGARLRAAPSAVHGIDAVAAKYDTNDYFDLRDSRSNCRPKKVHPHPQPVVARDGRGDGDGDAYMQIQRKLAGKRENVSLVTTCICPRGLMGAPPVPPGVKQAWRVARSALSSQDGSNRRSILTVLCKSRRESCIYLATAIFARRTEVLALAVVARVAAATAAAVSGILADCWQQKGRGLSALLSFLPTISASTRWSKMAG